MPYRCTAILLLALVWAGALALASSEPAAAAQYCKVGRIFYCEKYLGVCEKYGTGTRDCAAWHRACIECNETGTACGLTTTPVSAKCESCARTFSACMARTYRKFWPRHG